MDSRRHRPFHSPRTSGDRLRLPIILQQYKIAVFYQTSEPEAARRNRPLHAHTLWIPLMRDGLSSRLLKFAADRSPVHVRFQASNTHWYISTSNEHNFPVFISPAPTSIVKIVVDEAYCVCLSSRGWSGLG